MKEDSDARTAAKWNEICKRRLQDCAIGEKQLLQFAEDLERETKMFFWGTCLFVNDVAKRDSKEHKIGFIAYQIFYQHCPDRHAWTEFRYRSKDKARDIMPLIIRGLRNEKVTLGTDNEAPAAMVCATKKTKTDEIDNDERKFR